MSTQRCAIEYPRRNLARGIVQAVGRLVLSALFDVTIEGRENFPEEGPLIVVGNHVAIMEAVMMVICTPWQLEILGAADIPNERFVQVLMDFYGFIPVHRGAMDRPALEKALSVLKQGGIVGIFPEGGIWDAGAMRPQTGVSWLSYQGNAPVLPIGFSGTLGALNDALSLKRPDMLMRVGELLPAAKLPEGMSRKAYREKYAEEVVDAIKELLPPDHPTLHAKILDERFELGVTLEGANGEVEAPPELEIRHPEALAKLLHRPAILKIFRKNLQLSMEPLEELHEVRDPEVIAASVVPILEYLEEDNPYLLTYRFGPRGGRAMEEGLRELLALARWAGEAGLTLHVSPVRRYYSVEEERAVVQVEQDRFVGWM
jgi:1-acyl-sn-glycerol-3-phosphate acyltransferase